MAKGLRDWVGVKPLVRVGARECFFLFVCLFLVLQNVEKVKQSIKSVVHGHHIYKCGPIIGLVWFPDPS